MKPIDTSGKPRNPYPETKVDHYLGRTTPEAQRAARMDPSRGWNPDPNALTGHGSDDKGLSFARQKDLLVSVMSDFVNRERAKLGAPFEGSWPRSDAPQPPTQTVAIDKPDAPSEIADLEGVLEMLRQARMNEALGQASPTVSLQEKAGSGPSTEKPPKEVETNFMQAVLGAAPNRAARGSTMSVTNLQPPDERKAEKKDAPKDATKVATKDTKKDAKKDAKRERNERLKRAKEEALQRAKLLKEQAAQRPSATAAASLPPVQEESASDSD